MSLVLSKIKPYDLFPTNHSNLSGKDEGCIAQREVQIM